MKTGLTITGITPALIWAAIWMAAPISACQANGTVVLDRCAIVVDPASTSFVHYAVEELSGYLEHVTGKAVPIAQSDESDAPTRIAVGPETARRILGDLFPADELGHEGYLLKSVSQDGVLWIVASGATPQGTKNALSALMKTIRHEEHAASIPSELDRRGKPTYAIRGIHFNGWPLNYPYSFRSWREEDWQRYLDLLSYQQINLFYLWPFVEIMPVPFSAEDQAYLEECRRLIDYAQTKHGMEVWIMQCTNRVAKDHCGIADPRLRPYWRPESQPDLDPGQPADFQAILASREAMYRILNNADGVCNIDSDPGFCPGSSQDDYVKVLRACRALLDRHNIHGRDAKLINWMLWGWGRQQRIEFQGLVEHQRDALRHLKQGLPDSLWLISGQFPEFLPMCREAGFAERTVLMPYGTIEFEPAYPQTNVQIDAIRNMYNGPDAQSTDVAGLMGNMQAPLLQLPNMFFFTSVLADTDYRNRSERDVLEELAGYVYPRHRELLADAWLGLKATDPQQAEAVADRIERMLRQDSMGELGLFARKAFPDHRFVAESLLLQLRLRAAQERLVLAATSSASPSDCEKLLAEFGSAYLAWDTAHGWHALWGWNSWWLGSLGVDPRFRPTIGALTKILGDETAVIACLDRVAQAMSARHDPTAVRDGFIAPLRESLLTTH